MPDIRASIYQAGLVFVRQYWQKAYILLASYKIQHSLDSTKTRMSVWISFGQYWTRFQASVSVFDHARIDKNTYTDEYLG